MDWFRRLLAPRGLQPLRPPRRSGQQVEHVFTPREAQLLQYDLEQDHAGAAKPDTDGMERHRAPPAVFHRRSPATFSSAASQAIHYAARGARRHGRVVPMWQSTMRRAGLVVTEE